MNDEIQELLRLQKVDLDIDTLQDKKGNTPREIRLWEEELAKAERELEEFIANFKKKDLKLKELNLELENSQEKLNKYEKQLFEIKSNQEYRAMLNQIEKEKVKIRALEDKVIEAMEQFEETKIKRTKLEGNLHAKRHDIKEKIEGLKRGMIELDDLFLIKLDEQKRIAQHISKKILNQYKKLRSLRGGEVVVSVVDSTCGGCHAGLPIQTISELKVTEILGRCEHCGRMLVWQDNITTE